MKRQALALFSLVLLAMAAVPADAQKTTLPASATVVKRDQKWWTGQLRLARELGQKALIAFQNAPTDEGSPIDEAVHQAARDYYVLIRAARYGIEGAVNDDKWHDPVLGLAARKVNEAWHLSRSPVDKASSSMPRQEYLALAVRDLGQSVRLLDLVLITLP
jgi:hypothetical protein